VRAALRRWLGGGLDMVLALDDERSGTPVPRVHEAREIRAEARALLAELTERAKRAGQALYRGTAVMPAGVEQWTESLRDARLRAAMFRGGRVYELPRKHARGLRMADYLPDYPQAERQWITLVSVCLVEERDP